MAAILISYLVLAGNEGPADTRDANFARFGLADDPLMGSPDAPVVLVGFESPHCPSCQSFHKNVLPTLKQNHIDTGNVAYYYVQATIGHDTDLAGSIAQECALKVGGPHAFWNFTEMLYDRSNIYANADYAGYLDQFAMDEHLDQEQLAGCFDGKDTSKLVSSDYRKGRENGVQGTPTFFLFANSGEAIQVSSNTLEGAINDLLM